MELVYISGNYCDPPEIQNLEMLLQAYDEEDKENALRALNDPFIKHMDVEYAILARDMRLPQGTAVVQKKPIVENATDEYKRVRPQNDEVTPAGLVNVLLTNNVSSTFPLRLFKRLSRRAPKNPALLKKSLMNMPAGCAKKRIFSRFSL